MIVSFVAYCFAKVRSVIHNQPGFKGYVYLCPRAILMDCGLSRGCNQDGSYSPLWKNSWVAVESPRGSLKRRRNQFMKWLRNINSRAQGKLSTLCVKDDPVYNLAMNIVKSNLQGDDWKAFPFYSRRRTLWQAANLPNRGTGHPRIPRWTLTH